MKEASKELWRFMEKCYKEHGASCNGVQLILRDEHLNKMVDKYGEDKVYWLLENFFDFYHSGNEKIIDFIWKSFHERT